MKRICGLMVVLALLGLVFVGVGCGSTTTDTTATTDSSGATTSTTTTSTTEYDLGTDQLTSLVGIASNVWNIISNVIDATKTQRVKALTETEVHKAAVEIAIAVFDKYGRFPAATDIAAYVQAGTKPSDTALANFAASGSLKE